MDKKLSITDSEILKEQIEELKEQLDSIEKGSDEYYKALHELTNLVERINKIDCETVKTKVDCKNKSRNLMLDVAKVAGGAILIIFGKAITIVEERDTTLTGALRKMNDDASTFIKSLFKRSR